VACIAYCFARYWLLHIARCFIAAVVFIVIAQLLSLVCRMLAVNTTARRRLHYYPAYLLAVARLFTVTVCYWSFKRMCMDCATNEFGLVITVGWLVFIS
jgi:hypothetical protein